MRFTIFIRFSVFLCLRWNFYVSLRLSWYVCNILPRNAEVNSSVIRQKDESQNGCFKKTKHVKFPEKQTFLTSWYTHVHDRVSRGKCSFFGKFGVLCFLETPVLRFALLRYYRRITVTIIIFTLLVIIKQDQQIWHTTRQQKTWRVL